MNFGTPAAIFVSSFVIGLSGALMPGPLLAVTVRDASRRGFVAAPLIVLGHGILEAALVALILFGPADWLKGATAATVIALAGSLTLFWMAAGMVREVRGLRFAACGDGTAAGSGLRGGGHPGPWRHVLDGIVVSLSNPYWLIWWATIGLGYLVLSRGLGWAGIAVFFAGHILSDVAWYLFVGFAVSAGRGRLTDRLYRGVVGACAVFLFFFALSFGYLGVRNLIRMI